MIYSDCSNSAARGHYGGDLCGRELSAIQVGALMFLTGRLGKDGAEFTAQEAEAGH